MSQKQDLDRGFGSYAHLTLAEAPPILQAKLAAGFPHIAIEVPAADVDSAQFSLCRFNVAMTRYLRKDGQGGFPESPTNGRYYGEHQIPIAQTDDDKAAMLTKYIGSDTMIEVLVPGDLSLPSELSVLCFSDDDEQVVADVLHRLGSAWKAVKKDPPGDYPKKLQHRDAVAKFIEKSIAEESWRGNGLEFDRV
jgi:hypothetical protein